MRYSCDTEGGSSGSPVLSRTNNKVVALHHCGGGCNGNLGAPITDFYDDIAPYIGGTFPPSMAPVPCTGEYLTISVTADNYPSETAWTVKNDEGTLLYSSGSFSSGQTTTTTECLFSDCYTFEITDSYGDGLCCGYGIGSYTVTLDGTLIKSGGDFDYSESVNFCVDDTCIDSPTPFSATNGRQGCQFIASNTNYCDATQLNVKSHCPDTCSACAEFECADSQVEFKFNGNDIYCSDIPANLVSQACGVEDIRETCRGICGYCA